MSIYGKMFRPGEVILIYYENEPSLFARVERIMPDKKKGWWQMTFLPLHLPLQIMTWILDEDQLRGADFTMNQVPLRIERVESMLEAEEVKEKKKPPKESSGGRIISMFDEEEPD